MEKVWHENLATNGVMWREDDYKISGDDPTFIRLVVYYEDKVLEPRLAGGWVTGTTQIQLPKNWIFV